MAKAPKNGNGEKAEAPPGTFRLERRADGVAVLVMDVAGETMNTLKASFAEELEAILSEIDRASDVKAVVFASGKEDSFVAGADISMLEGVTRAEDGEALAARGHEVMGHARKLSKPMVAAIHGACLGGGLEVALACRARVASDDKRTKLGLPEVQLGLLPGAGGTQLLPRLIGVQSALDLLLTGKQVDARKAKRLGLVDEVVPRAILLEVAAAHALRLAGAPAERGGRPRWLENLLDRDRIQEALLAQNPIGRKVLFDQARKQLRAKTRGNYPAPERILQVVETGLARGLEAGLAAERRAFGELLVTNEARALMSIFFATQELKKDTGADDPSVEPRRVAKVGILGAGLMGAGIAYVTAANTKTPVRLKDRDDDGVLRGLSYVRGVVDGRVRRKRLSPLDADRLMTRVTGATDYSGFDDADIVIEAVFEDLELKHRVLEETEAACSGDTIFASNTSSIPISQIAAASAHPETVIGMHYFSPVHKMPLLEIIVTDRTAPWVTATCVALGKKQGKTVIVVRDGVGFYTTRILAPFMNEAAHVLSEGVAIEKIDGALMDFGFPLGPIKLTDEVGIDVGAKVGKILLEAFGERMVAPPGMENVVADGRLGRKNGRGFYRYGAGKKGERGVDESIYGVLGVRPDHDVPPEEIAERCALAMVNEAALCYGEGILRSARDGDVGAIFGLGFPPFLGGPFRWVDALGAAVVVKKLERYRDLHGRRFEPAPILVEMARADRTFHGRGAAPPGRRPTGRATAARASTT